MYIVSDLKVANQQKNLKRLHIYFTSESWITDYVVQDSNFLNMTDSRMVHYSNGIWITDSKLKYFHMESCRPGLKSCFFSFSPVIQKFWPPALKKPAPWFVILINLCDPIYNSSGGLNTEHSNSEYNVLTFVFWMVWY